MLWAAGGCFTRAVYACAYTGATQIAGLTAFPDYSLTPRWVQRLFRVFTPVHLRCKLTSSRWPCQPFPCSLRVTPRKRKPMAHRIPDSAKPVDHRGTCIALPKSETACQVRLVGPAVIVVQKPPAVSAAETHFRRLCGVRLRLVNTRVQELRTRDEQQPAFGSEAP